MFALTVAHDRTPEPFVDNACPEEPSAFGNAYVTEAVKFPTVNPE